MFLGLELAAPWTTGSGAEARRGGDKQDEFTEPTTRFGTALGGGWGLELFEVLCFPEGGAFGSGDDGAEEAGEDGTCTDFEPAVDTSGSEGFHGGGPENGAGNLLVDAFAGIGSEGDFPRFHVVDEGDAEIVEGGRIQVRAETQLGGFHERAVERGADGKRDDAFRSGGFGEFHGSFDGALVAGDDDLVGRVQVGGGDDFALGGFGEDAGECFERHPEDGGHGPDTGGDCVLHILATFADEAEGVAEVEATGGDERGVFAEGVAGNIVRGTDFSFEHGPGGDRDGQERGLGVFGEAELVVGAFETEFGEREAEGIIGLFEAAPGGLKVLREGEAHARELRALAGEEESGFHRIPLHYRTGCFVVMARGYILSAKC